MRNLRIIFMGTPDFAVATLKTLVEANYNIVGVITAPDKPAGRGQKLTESAVKQYAVSQNLNVLQPTNLKNDDFLNHLKQLNANLQIVVAFRMLPKAVWQMPEFGTFNLHASLLPNYRGAAPIHWAIINGETTTGVSTFFIDEEIDTGDMILQETIAINPDENAGSLHDTLMNLGSILVLKTVNLIENENVKTIPQKTASDIKTAHKLNRDSCKIDSTASLNSIYNLIRGLSPYPVAWSLMQDGEQEWNVKIYEATFEKENHSLAIGTIVSTKKEMKMAVSDGFIHILSIQFPGKKKMTVQELLNGMKFSSTAMAL